MLPIRRPSRTTEIVIRGLRHTLRLWGPDDGPQLVVLHGIRDAAITFQFAIDAMARDWRIVGLDWRGHGGSDWAPGGYWFPDYVADLDALLDHLSPDAPARVVGHSLGGNAACLYAGVRPERVSHLVVLDAFGLPDGASATAPQRLRNWLDAERATPPQRPYRTRAEMAARLRSANPRLSEAQAGFLAGHLSRGVDGGFVWQFDPAHRRPSPGVYHFADAAAVYAQVRAKTLFIGSGSDFPPSLASDPWPIEQRVALIPGARSVRLPNTGHNLHHDEPAQVAALIEEFLEDG